MAKYGKWTFLVGLIVAVAASVQTEWTWTVPVLAVIGVVVGFLNVTSADSKTFLLAAIGLSLSTKALETIPYIGEWVTPLIANVMAFIGAAMLVVAVKALVETAKD